MNTRYIIFALILFATFLLAACSPNAAAPDAMEDMDAVVEGKVMDGVESMQDIEEEIVEVVLAEQMETIEAEILPVAEEMSDESMEEKIPEVNTESEWILISRGQFKGADASHQGSGTAGIFQQDDQRVLRFEDFAVTDGPDLHVLLVENTAATDHEAIDNYIDLGKLKGSSGSQEYEINPDVDLSQYQGVMIYCEPFEVVFATAPFGN